MLIVQVHIGAQVHSTNLAYLCVYATTTVSVLFSFLHPNTMDAFKFLNPCLSSLFSTLVLPYKLCCLNDAHQRTQNTHMYANSYLSHTLKKVRENDQEIPHSQTVDKPMAL